MNRKPLALRYVSHIGCGGEHPPDFTAMGLTECEAMPAPAWESGSARHTNDGNVPP